jgi:hypothetical protein
MNPTVLNPMTLLMVTSHGKPVYLGHNPACTIRTGDIIIVYELHAAKRKNLDVVKVL